MAEPAEESGPAGNADVSASHPSPPPIPANRYRLPRGSLRFFPKLADEGDHPQAWSIPAYLDNPAVPWLRVLKDLYAAPGTFPASFSPEAGLLLFSLVRNIRPRLVVEVGTFLGVSTVWIAAALEAAAADPQTASRERTGNRQQTTSNHRDAPGVATLPTGVIHCFDDFGPMAPGPWRDAHLEGDRDVLVDDALERAGLSHRAVLHKGDSSANIIGAREALRGGGGVDFALIDGDHSREGVLNDLWAVEPVLNTGGYVLLHDTFPEQCGDHGGPRHLIDNVDNVAQGLYEWCELYTAPLNYGMALLRRIG